MTDTERGLLDSILEHPDDDTVRLVYADWLDENGEPERAAFIRAQINQKYGWLKPRAHQIRQWFRWPFRDRIFHANRGRAGHTANLCFSNQRTGSYREFSVFSVRRGFLEEICIYPEFLDQFAWKTFRKNPIQKISLYTGRLRKVEIDAPGEGYGWQAYYYENPQEEYVTMNGWETRDEMILGVVADIREAYRD